MHVVRHKDNPNRPFLITHEIEIYREPESFIYLQLATLEILMGG